MSMPTDESQEAAERLRRPGWKDPRLLAGVLIVLLSVAGVTALVSSQGRTVPVYAADRAMAVGEQLREDDLRIVEVRIDEVSDQYLSAEQTPEADLQFVAVVDEGELIPQRAVGVSDPLGRQAVTLEVEHALAQGVEPGRAVDLWAVRQGTVAEQEEASRAEQLVAAAEVSAVSESSSTFGSATVMTVELLIDPDDMPAVLEARSSAGSLSIIPTGADPDSAADPETTESDSADPDSADSGSADSADGTEAEETA